MGDTADKFATDDDLLDTPEYLIEFSLFVLWA